MTADEPPLLTIEDLATILHRSGYGQTRVLGNLPPAQRFGDQLYWTRAKFMKWIESREEPDDYNYEGPLPIAKKI